MTVTFEIPDDMCIVAFTLVTPLPAFDCINTFTHCFTAEDGKVLRVICDVVDGKPNYRAEEDS